MLHIETVLIPRDLVMHQVCKEIATGPVLYVSVFVSEMAGRALTIRLKTKDGNHVVNQFTLESTLQELKQKISDLTKIPSRALRILQVMNAFLTLACKYL